MRVLSLRSQWLLPLERSPAHSLFCSFNCHGWQRPLAGSLASGPGFRPALILNHDVDETCRRTFRYHFCALLPSMARSIIDSFPATLAFSVDVRSDIKACNDSLNVPLLHQSKVLLPPHQYPTVIHQPGSLPHLIFGY